MMLLENSQLYRGIFWITNTDNLWSSELYFQIPCDSFGSIDPEFTLSTTMSSTGSDNYNHQKVWNTLDRKITKNKPFNYYPRGRVEISNGVAKVYHSPRIPQNELEKWVKEKFNLTKHNGIKKIKLIADGSEHYKCYLDKED